MSGQTAFVNHLLLSSLGWSNTPLSLSLCPFVSSFLSGLPLVLTPGSSFYRLFIPSVSFPSVGSGPTLTDRLRDHVRLRHRAQVHTHWSSDEWFNEPLYALTDWESRHSLAPLSRCRCGPAADTISTTVTPHGWHTHTEFTEDKILPWFLLPESNLKPFKIRETTRKINGNMEKKEIIMEQIVLLSAAKFITVALLTFNFLVCILLVNVIDK